MKRFGVMRMLIVAAAFVCEFGSFESENRRNVIVDLKANQCWPAGNAVALLASPCQTRRAVVGGAAPVRRP